MSVLRRAGKRFEKRAIIGLSAVDERRLRAKLRRATPSEPWVDVQFVELCQVNERGETIVRRLHDASAFPPGGDRTSMVRCRKCGIFTPPIATENGACLDHAEHGNWGLSPSARAIAALQYRNVRLSEGELEPESYEDLEKEIREHRRRSRRSEMRAII